MNPKRSPRPLPRLAPAALSPTIGMRPSRPARRRLVQGVRWGAAAAAAALMIGVLGIGPQPAAVGVVQDGWDKLVHFGLHGVLALLGLVALGDRRAGWVLVACIAFGALDEGLQAGYPGRNASAADFAADVAGALLALAAAAALRAAVGRWSRGARARG